MIISQTPYRVSFAGGGTDLPAYYRQESGAVLSTAIDHYIYVHVHRRFEPNIRIAYSRTEIASNVSEIQHDLVREALKFVGIDEPLEITTIGDVPAGTGMGSSSTLTVSLLHALYTYRGRLVSLERLAEEACHIELELLGKPIGRQDQYAAALGGINYIRFNPDDSVDVEPVPCSAPMLRELERHMLLIYTNTTRCADTLLMEQTRSTVANMSLLRRMRELVEPMRNSLTGIGNLQEFASLLNEGWKMKRMLTSGITTDPINDLYERARRAGAEGGKLLGAGGGGFMLLIAPPDRHHAIRESLGRPHELPFRFARHGSRIIYFHE
jgi:D-glycero-alpha-D-manno-heptose-7-phosphate kinase